MMNVILNLAPTGMIPTKQMTKYVPLTIKEIVDDVREAVEIGITMVHLHARDEITGEPSHDPEIYKRIIAGIRLFAEDLIICVSTSGRIINEIEKRSAVLKLEGDVKPDMGSLTLSSTNFNQQASINAPDTIKKLAQKMICRGILPELEAFDVGMINYAKYLEKKNLIRAPYYFNLILGNIACAQADLLHAGMMIRDLPRDSYWSFGGVGDAQIMVNAIAIAAGGGVRVGLEDNIWYDRNRKRLAKNSELVGRIHKLAEANDRKIMTSAELRKRLNLENGKSKYGLSAKKNLDIFLDNKSLAFGATLD